MIDFRVELLELIKTCSSLVSKVNLTAQVDVARGHHVHKVSAHACLQASELVARVFKQVEQGWRSEMVDVALILTSSRGSQYTRQIQAGPSPLLNHLQDNSWVPTWTGFQHPQHAILRKEAATTPALLERIFTPIGPVTLMAAQVRFKQIF